MGISYRNTTQLGFGELPELSLPPITPMRSAPVQWLRDFYHASLEVRDYLELFAREKPNRTLQRKHQVILMGHMVRLYKLYDTFLMLVASGRSEIAYMFWRLIAETGIHLRFLIKRGTESVFDSYLRASLACN